LNGICLTLYFKSLLADVAQRSNKTQLKGRTKYLQLTKRLVFVKREQKKLYMNIIIIK